jgi:hypothetical protein
MTDIQSVFTKFYVPEVMLKYQKPGILVSLVNNIGNIVGDSVRWSQQDKKVAHPVIRGSIDAATTRNYNNFEAKIKDLQTNDYLFRIDERKTLNYPSLASKIGVQHGLEITRGMDQIIINDALATSTNAPIDLTSTGITIESLEALSEYFDDLGASEEDRFILIGAKQKTQVIEAVKSLGGLAAFNVPAISAITTGSIGGFQLLGFNFIVMETRAEGGLPVNGDNKLCFAFKRDAIGFASQLFKVGEVSFISNYGAGADYINTVVSCASTIINQEGVVPLNVKNVA